MTQDLQSRLHEIKKEGIQYQSIFFHIPLNPDLQLKSNCLNIQSDLWKILFEILDDSGILWCLANNSQTTEGLDILPLELAMGLQKIGFHTHNIVLWYNNEYPLCASWFTNRYSHVLFLTKKESNYKFNIDVVREPHIWKDYEWGGGRKDRYHPLGKNPSNFWLKTISRKGKTINHVPLTWEEMVARCLKSCTEPDDTVLGIVPRNRDFGEVSKELNLRTKLVSLPPETGIHFQKKPWEAAQELARKGEGQSSPRIFYKSSESMDEIKSGEIQTIVTSPPYWGLRDYGIRNQIGFNESYQEYLGRLETVWAECHRILNDRGVLWININKRVVKGRILLFPVDIIKSCLKIGFKLQDIVIWFRAISVPSAGQENFTDRYEYIMMLTKTDKFKFYRNRLKSRDFFNEKEFDLINVWKLFRKIGNLSEDINAKTKIAVKHTAMFPEELVRRAVVLSSDEGEVVLDPFLGSGTTVAVAKSLRRTGVGYEINEAFKPLIKAKLKDDGQSLSKFL